MTSEKIENKKATAPAKVKVANLSRRDKIRTCDLCVPNAALYQTEPRDDVNIKIIYKKWLIVKQKTLKMRLKIKNRWK